MLPGAQRLKGGAPLLGAHAEGQVGPFGLCGGDHGAEEDDAAGHALAFTVPQPWSAA